MSYPRKGSTKWRGWAKGYVRYYVDAYNAILEIVESDYRLRVRKVTK